MITRYAVLFTTLLLSPVTSSSASDIDRYLESTTAAVAHVDVQQLDLPKIFDFVQTKFPVVQPDPARAAFLAVASGVVRSLRDADVTRVYATVSTLELTDGQIAVIIPTNRPQALVAQLKIVMDMLPESLGYQVHVGQGAVLVATEPVLKRLAQPTSADRSELISAVERIAREPFGLVLNIRPELRQSIAEIFPESLPSSIPAELSPKQLMKDIVALQLTAHAPPELQVSLAAICSDSEAAQRTGTVVEKVLEQIPVSGLRLDVSDEQIRVTATEEHWRATVETVTAKWAAIQQSNKLKRVINAMHDFHTKYRHFPPRMTVSEQGKPLLSWRVFLLPYLGEQALYNEFHLDEPWDSEHNRTLVNRIPEVYRSLQFPELPRDHTLIQLPLLPGSVWAGADNRFVSLSALGSDASETVCIVEAPPQESILWTKPDDLSLSADSLMRDLFGERLNCLVAMFDGSVQELPRTIDAAKLRALFPNRSQRNHD